MVFTVFSKHSRFQTLIRLSSKLQSVRQSAKIIAIAIILSGLSSTVNYSFGAQKSAAKDKHIDAFGELLVQDHQGRIEPVSTLASDLLRKIAKADHWEGISVEEALELVSKKTKEVRDASWKGSYELVNIKTGLPESLLVNRAEGIAFLGSAEVDNEESYLISKFSRLIGTPYNEHQARI